MSKRKIIVGSRGSKLSLIQTNEVISELKRITNKYSYDIKIIKTHADKFNTIPLHKLGKKGVFVKEIDNALLKGEIDISVHSMKDLPSELHEDIVIGAVPERKTYKDVIYSRENKNLEKIEKGSIIGTGSFRRKSQILFIRKDLEVRNIRGNVETRIRKVDDGEYDAVVIARVGIQRLNLAKTIFNIPEQFLPAAGQGALAVEVRSDNEELKSLLSKINHQFSHLETLAERTFIKTIGGGCHVPIGVLGKIKNDKLTLSGEILDLDGNIRIFSMVLGNMYDAKIIANKLAKKIQNQGGNELLEKIREGLKGSID